MSQYLFRFIKYGIRDMHTVPFTKGEVLPAIPQSAGDREFGLADIEAGLRAGVSQEITKDYALQKVKEGLLVSSSFTVWQGDGEDLKGWFILNFDIRRKHWPKGSFKMETVPSFAVEMEPGEFVISFDIKAGYSHFYLHPYMRYSFLFHYCGRYFCCGSLPF